MVVKVLCRTLVPGLLLGVIDLGDYDEAQLIVETLNELEQLFLHTDLGNGVPTAYLAPVGGRPDKAAGHAWLVASPRAMLWT